jgi:oligopeptide/dipeptide ABC transporter ATP-binding protein
MDALLSVQDLRTHFITREYVLKAVDGVDFSIPRGGTLGIVGESGSGKSITSLSLMRLISPPGKIVSGSIVFDGRDLLTLSEREMQKMRGKDMAMIFQDPLTALNPVLTIGYQVSENILMHERISRKEAEKRTVELLDMVRIPSARKRLRDFPHQFSGGMRQRVMIAMALACKPRFLIADEPTTALDVTIQAQIMELVGSLTKSLGMALLLITHNLGLVKKSCVESAVMYSGTIMEKSSTEDLFRSPLHPYTQGLLNSLPRLRGARGERLIPIDGQPPSPLERPSGCVFHPRCPKRIENRCQTESPLLREVGPGRRVRCHLY